jgi:hypothetical protein
MGGTELKVIGNLKGDLLEPKALLLDAEAVVHGDLRRTMEILDIQENISGQVEFRGRVRMDLLQARKTLQANGELVGRNLVFQNWHLDRVDVKGQWEREAGGTQRAIRVTEAVIESAVTPRVGGSRPAQGGRIEIGSFAVNLDAAPGQAQQVKVPVRLHQVHAQWAGAVALKDLYPLDFRVDGPAEFTLTQTGSGSASSWKVDALIDFKIPKFQFDNQKWNQERPLSKIIEASDLRLHGGVEINPKALVTHGLVLDLPKSRLDVSGGIDFKA